MVLVHLCQGDCTKMAVSSGEGFDTYISILTFERSLSIRIQVSQKRNIKDDRHLFKVFDVLILRAKSHNID